MSGSLLLPYRGLGLVTQRSGGAAGGTVSAIIMGQSEMVDLLAFGSDNRQFAQPSVVGDGNVIVYTQTGTDAPVRTSVNSTTVAAGSVNPAMAALSAFMAYVRPGWTFVVGDGAVGGTARGDLADDAATARAWSDFEAVADALVTETGGPVGHLIECWYNADSARIDTFRTAFWPLYFGTDGSGATFTLGSTHALMAADVDHCLWDSEAAEDAAGRGLFAKSETSWHVITPMPFHDAPVSPDAALTNFSSNSARLSEPARAAVIALADNAQAQSVRLRVGPSAHVCKFAPNDEIHPDATSPDGQILLMWPIAMALLRASGRTIGEPVIVAVEGPEDGSYADVLVSLPNGGTLTTLRTLRDGTYSGASPHRQAVTGFEVARGVSRAPVYSTSETGFSADFRGTVAIQAASETHGTHGRVGRVRITPTNAFSFGNGISYLRGQATAALLEPRDFELYPDFLIEHVPSLYDATADYPFEGLAVAPYQSDLAVAVPQPSFLPRGAGLDGSTYYAGTTDAGIPVGGDFVMSFWLRNSLAEWGLLDNVMEARDTFGTVLMSLRTNLTGRLRFQYQGPSGPVITSFYAGAGNTQFAVDTWYHIAIAGTDAGGLQVYVNGAQVVNITPGALAADTVTQLGIGASVTGEGTLTGDLGHFYINFAETVNLSTGLSEFMAAGDPVDLGGDGSGATGTAPEVYFDGDAPDWSNRGTAGNVTLTGTLTVSDPFPGF